MPEIAGWKFSLNSKPFFILRVSAYVIIIACLWFCRSPRKSAAPVQKPAANASANAGTGADGTLTTETTLYYPTVTLYGWRVKPMADGSQQVDVLMKFGANSEAIGFKELKLRAKGSVEDLALAEEVGGATNVKLGMGMLTFQIPAGKPEFRAGQIYLWVKDLCILNSNQRLAPEDFEKWETEMEQAGQNPGAEKTEPEKPDAKQPPTTPTVAPEGVIPASV